MATLDITQDSRAVGSSSTATNISTQELLACDPVKTIRTTPYPPWHDIAASKKAEQLSRIPPEWHLPSSSPPTTKDLRPLAQTSGLLSSRELEITNTPDATSLLGKIASGTYTSVEVVTAFCKRAAVAQQFANCLTEIMFADAIAAAEKLDEEFERNGGKVVGPLHGLPMTFKVSIGNIFLRFEA